MPSKEDLSTGASDKETFPLEVQLGEIIGLGLILPWAGTERGVWLYTIFVEPRFIPFCIRTPQVEALTLNVARQWGS